MGGTKSLDGVYTESDECARDDGEGVEVYRVIDFDIFKAENELVISKSNLKQAATKGDVDQLKKEIKGLEIHFNEELARSESKIKSELFKQTDSLEKTLEVTAEMVKLTLKTGLRKEMDIVVERAMLRTLEQMRKDKMEILGAVADFGKSTTDLETGSNFITARVADHEERLTKLEEA